MTEERECHGEGAVAQPGIEIPEDLSSVVIYAESVPPPMDADQSVAGMHKSVQAQYFEEFLLC